MDLFLRLDIVFFFCFMHVLLNYVRTLAEMDNAL